MIHLRRELPLLPRKQPYSLMTTIMKDYSKDASEETKIELLREAVVEGRNFIQQIEPKTVENQRLSRCSECI